MAEQRFRKARVGGSTPLAGLLFESTARKAENMPRFREVLKNRNFFLLWIGQIISQLGDRLGQMALIGFIPADAPGSGLQLAKILSFTILPVFLIGPVAGVYVDRWDRRRTLYASDILRTVLTLFIPLFLISKDSLGLIYLLIFIIFSIGRFFVPAKLSIVPEIVSKEQLLIGNSLINITGMIAAIAGFGIGGLIVEYFGAEGGFYLDALSFFVSAALIFFISSNKSAKVKIGQVGREIVEVIQKSVIQEVKEGVTYFIKQKEVRFTGLIMFLLGAAGGSVYIAGIIFIRQALKTATLDLGLLIMFLGAGLFLGSVIYGRFGARLSHYKTIFASLVLSGIMLVIFALGIERYPYFLIAAALSFLLGLFVAPIMVASNTIVHKASDASMMGKTFSSIEIAIHLGFLIFMFVSSFLAEKLSSVIVLVAIGIIFSIVGMVNLICQRKISWLD